jgi:GH24 family phage-related lysozyme (muramidase)
MDTELEKLLIQDLTLNEGEVPWMYCDVKGLVTVGIGNLVKTPEVAVELPFCHLANQKPASDEEKHAAWAKVHRLYEQSQSALMHTSVKLSAQAYRAVTDLRLPLDASSELLARRLRAEFLPAARRVFQDFDQWPQTVQRAVVDMTYSLGEHGLVSKFPSFVAACRIQDWQEAAKQCMRESGRRSDGSLGRRNEWTMDLLGKS